MLTQISRQPFSDEFCLFLTIGIESSPDAPGCLTGGLWVRVDPEEVDDLPEAFH
jgi:hypothetical protein